MNKPLKCNNMYCLCNLNRITRYPASMLIPFPFLKFNPAAWAIGHNLMIIKEKVISKSPLGSIAPPPQFIEIRTIHYDPKSSWFRVNKPSRYLLYICYRIFWWCALQTMVKIFFSKFLICFCKKMLMQKLLKMRHNVICFALFPIAGWHNNQ